MTLFPSALRSDRLTATGTPVRPLHRLGNLIAGLFAHRPSTASPALSLVISHEGAKHAERIEPQLQWTDAHRPPAGDFAASAIPNAELDLTAVPRRGESWDAVSDFALSYDGYAYWDDLSTLAGRVLQRWTRRRSLPATLDELRGCLFYEQRRWNHFGEEPTGRSAEYMWAMVEAIGAMVARVSPKVTPSPVALSPVAPIPGAPVPGAPIPDPRRAVAPEAHVKLVTTRAVALRTVPSPPVTVRALSARPGRLTPGPAAEAHVRMVSAIETDAGATSRHPAGHATRRPSGQLSGSPAVHPALHRAGRALLPMPSADPLPKPPVIVRRARRAGFAGANRPGGAVNSAPAQVTPLCHEFFVDDGGYGTWIDAHPDGFVLNQPRSARSKPPTLHRVGCPVVARRAGTERGTGCGPDADTNGTAPADTNAVRVCGPSGDALTTWSMARGTEAPTPCRRCCP